MKLSRLIAVAAFLLPLPAAAQDLTAIYRSDEGRKDETRFEIAANGDLRVDLGAHIGLDVRAGLDDRLYLLSHDGTDYLVTRGPGGPIVTRVEDLAAAYALHPGHPYPLDAKPTSRGTVTINDRSGVAYGFPPIEPSPPQPPFLVVSNDPELAPLGRAFHHFLTMQAATDPDFGAGFNRVHALLGAGAPLRLLPVGDLVSVSHAAVPASHFALPAPPRRRDEVLQDYATDLGHAQLTDPNDRRMIKRAVYAGGRLWLLADDGTLMTIDPATRTLAEVATPRPVADLCRVRDAPVIVTGDAARWSVWGKLATGWQSAWAVPIQNDTLVALACSGDRLDLLTNQRLIELALGETHPVTLSKSIEASLIASIYDDGQALFVGRDAGEWGGGLIRIDRATGTVTQIERRGPGACEGPLDAACDPVNGIAAEPGKPDCLIASVGLQHFMPSGRLVEICGNQIGTYYAKPYTLDPDWHFDRGAPEPHQAVPFYGMAAVSDALWAVGTDGLYRIDADGIRFTKLPAFEEIGGIWVSFALPNMVLVETSINARQSIGGPAILLVPE